MIAFQDGADKWWFLSNDKYTQHLFWFDPATGNVTYIATLDRPYEGLAMGPDDTFYAAYENELWTLQINGPDDVTETLIGTHAFMNVEALEWAYGDNQPSIQAPGVPATWTMDGILFGYSEADDALMIIQPSKGKAVEWPCSFQTVDFTGMVFTTQLRDPYAMILASARD